MTIFFSESAVSFKNVLCKRLPAEMYLFYLLIWKCLDGFTITTNKAYWVRRYVNKEY